MAPAQCRGQATFSLDDLLCGPGDQGKSERETDWGTHGREARGGLKPEVSEGAGGGTEGQFHGPPQKTSKDAGGTGEALFRGQLGCGDRALHCEQRQLPPLRSRAPPAIRGGTGQPRIQTLRGGGSPRESGLCPGASAAHTTPLCVRWALRTERQWCGFQNPRILEVIESESTGAGTPE